MPKRRVVDLREGPQPLLNIASYGRRGSGHRPPSKAEIAHISRTVRRTPEVVVKVSGGARSLRGVSQHLDYIGREGRGEVQTDDGERLQGKGFEKELLEDWDLDLEAQRRRSERAIAAGRKPPKLVHNLVFSMPKGTPPDKVLRAVQVFARERFALKHRYAMALHVDQGHPHVHVVVKAVSEQGVRLYIRKPVLREWRQDFAKYLRDIGVEANATERAVRGETRITKRDGIHRAMLRGQSTHMRARVEAVAREFAAGGHRPEPGKRVLLETRQAVLDGWRGLADVLDRDGNPRLAAAVRRFAETMLPPLTEKETIARQLGPLSRNRRISEQAVTR
jgi:type IV secretory pathway VirD2 relaxase